MHKHLVKTKEAARHVRVTDATIRNWVKAGRIRGYVDPEVRGLYVDLAEVENQERVRRAAYGSYGQRARISTIKLGDAS